MPEESEGRTASNDAQSRKPNESDERMHTVGSEIRPYYRVHVSLGICKTVKWGDAQGATVAMQ